MPGGWEWLIILVVLVVLFGAKRLPELARSVGQSARVFKGEMKGMRDDDTQRPTRPAPPAPAALPPADQPVSGATGATATGATATGATATGATAAEPVRQDPVRPDTDR
jgi:sec-independent protein translocase protein TatA